MRPVSETQRQYALALAALRVAITRFDACASAQETFGLLQEASRLLIPSARCSVMQRQADGCLEIAAGLPDQHARILPEDGEHAIESGWVATAIKQGLYRVSWRDETWVLAKLASPRFVHGIAIWVESEIPESLHQPLCAMADLAALALDRLSGSTTLPPTTAPAEREPDRRKRRFGSKGPQAATPIDPLTGLAQRAPFLYYLKQAFDKLAVGQAVGVMLLDIDGFHRVNRELGCAAGDQVLRSFAHRLESVFRSPYVTQALGIVSSDLCIARTGADELGIAVGHLRLPEHLLDVAGEVQQHLAEGFFQGSQRLYLSVSIGLAAVSPSMGDVSAETLLRRADSALKRAKSLGRNRSVLYDPIWGESGAVQLRTESLLHEALQRSGFRLHFQPLFDVTDLRLVGAEVLLRLSTSDGVPVPPSSFIPVAENTGQIVEISDWVLHRLCHQIREWDRQGLPSVPFSVNLSGIEFGQDDLIDRLTKILSKHSVLPCRVHLEVTETAIARNEVQALANIKAARAAGFEVWLDDFGTGYSSLKSLKNLPVSGIKIDREFVADLAENPNTAVIAQSIIEIAQKLGYPVVAEGIEQQAQLEFLRARCCDIGQGFHLGRPVCAQDFEQQYLTAA
jgi:diguanylate cyclase (GGDEF)-like protein